MTRRLIARHAALIPAYERDKHNVRGLRAHAPSIIEAGSVAHVLWGARPGLDTVKLVPRAWNARARSVMLCPKGSMRAHFHNTLGGRLVCWGAL